VSHTRRRAGVLGAAEAVIHGWAIAGGLVLLAVVLVNVLSVLGNIFWRPFPGDFELTEMGVAVAAFAFLPFCQLTDANVTADIFTARASERWISRFRFAAALVALLFALLLAWRMYAGMLDQRTYGYETAILQIPNWWAYVPILCSLVLLAVAALITLARGGRAARQGSHLL
jgi:TRAP-type C4-dicarboxylate transport system permease small subunit